MAVPEEKPFTLRDFRDRQRLAAPGRQKIHSKLCGYKGYYGDIEKFPDFNVSRIHGSALTCDKEENVEKLNRYNEQLDELLKENDIDFVME